MKEKQSVVDTDSTSLSRTTLLTPKVEAYVCVSFFAEFHDTSGTRCQRDVSAEKIAQNISATPAILVGDVQ